MPKSAGSAEQSEETMFFSSFFFAVGKPHRPVDPKLTGEELAVTPLHEPGHAVARSTRTISHHPSRFSVE
jgi:hypothetical protein